MAKRRRKDGDRGTFSSRNMGLTLSGVTQLIKRLDEGGAEIEKLIPKLLKESAEIPYKDMVDFMMYGKTSNYTPSHDVHSHDRSGDTLESLEVRTRTRKGKGLYEATAGFGKDDSLPALFLDIGTPHQEPTFFMYYAFHNNIAAISKLQKEFLQKVLDKMKGE